MRDRLVELIDNKQEYGLSADSPPEQWLVLSNEDLADYLLENGVVVPPVKIGQELWEIHYNRPKKWEVVYLGYNGKEWFINIHWWKDRHNFSTKQITYPFLGKMWYFTREEAEQALKGGVEE